MSTLSDIKKRLGLSTTLPLGSSGSAMPLTGAHLHSHSHGAGCGCGHAHDDEDGEE